MARTVQVKQRQGCSVLEMSPCSAGTSQTAPCWLCSRTSRSSPCPNTPRGAGQSIPLQSSNKSLPAVASPQGPQASCSRVIVTLNRVLILLSSRIKALSILLAG